MNGRQNGIKIGIIIVTAVVILLAVFVVPKYIEIQEAEKKLYEETASIELELRPLESERAKLKRELAKLDKNNVRYNMSMSSTIILVTEPDERVLTDIAPVLDEKGYNAVLCVSEEKFPGKEGMMSLSDAISLTSKGWEIAINTDENTDIYNMYFKIKDSGLGYAEALYIPRGEATDYMVTESRDLLIPMIIKHQSNDSKGDEGHIYVGSIGASDSSNKKTYEKAVSYSEPIAISMGYTEPFDLFSANKLKNILTSVDDAKKSDSTEVVGVKGTLERIKERDEKIASGEMKTADERKEIEERLAEIEEKIEALNSK